MPKISVHCVGLGVYLTIKARGECQGVADRSMIITCIVGTKISRTVSRKHSSTSWSSKLSDVMYQLDKNMNDLCAGKFKLYLFEIEIYRNYSNDITENIVANELSGVAIQLQESGQQSNSYW